MLPFNIFILDSGGGVAKRNGVPTCLGRRLAWLAQRIQALNCPCRTPNTPSLHCLQWGESRDGTTPVHPQHMPAYTFDHPLTNDHIHLCFIFLLSAQEPATRSSQKSDCCPTPASIKASSECQKQSMHRNEWRERLLASSNPLNMLCLSAQGARFHWLMSTLD